MGMLGPLLNRKSDLSVRKGFLLYEGGPKSSQPNNENPNL